MRPILGSNLFFVMFAAKNAVNYARYCWSKGGNKGF
jgi:hypothetical protein